MATEYPSYEITPGCPPEHISTEEGDDNTSGIILDIHKIASKASGWDSIRNHDIEAVGKRLISLELKVGELGYDSTASKYTPVPKSVSVPNYNSNTQSVMVGRGDITASYPIGGSPQYTSNGKTHVASIVNLDRSIQEVVARVGIPKPNEMSPGSGGANFIGTYKYNSQESFTLTEDKTLVYPDGPVTPPTYGTTVQTKTFPAYYKSNDAALESIAKVDYNLYKEVTELRSELNELKHFIAKAFNDINKLKTSLLNDSVLVIDPEWDVDDNGLVLSSGGSYVASVVYTVTLKNGPTSSTPFTTSSSTSSTPIVGARVLPIAPFTMFLTIGDVVPPYNNGSPTDVDVTIVATDSSGNTTTAFKTLPIG